MLSAGILSAGTAQAGTIIDTGTNGGYGGTGFGNILSLLVMQANGSEYGSVAWNGAAKVLGGDAATQSDVQSAATLTSNGYGATFPLILNLGEQGGSPEVTIHDFTLRFYSAAGGILFDITYDLPDLGQVLTDDGGTGQSGRVFTVSLTAGEQASFFADGNNRLGMFVTEANAFEGTGGSAENFYIPKSQANQVDDPASVPEPATWGVAAVGIAGLALFAARQRRRRAGLKCTSAWPDAMTPRLPQA